MPGKKQSATGAVGGFMGLIGLSAVAGLLITAAVTPAIAVAGTAASQGLEIFDQIPSYLEIDQGMLPTTIYAKSADDPEKDVVLATIYEQNRTPVKYDQIAPVVFDAVLSSEDPRFYQHGGVDLIGTGRAALNNLTNSSTQGASSISQQYVKNILLQRCEKNAKTPVDVEVCAKQAQDNSGSTGIQRKLQEMRYAMRIEKEYPKDDILLGYLNIAHFGGVTYGIESAAQYYFGVSANRLNLSQASILAGMVNQPNVYWAEMLDTQNEDSEARFKNTKSRQSYVLKRMLEDGKITQAQHDEAFAEPIEPKLVAPTSGCSGAKGAEYFCQLVRNVLSANEALGENQDDRNTTLRRGGLKVYTTLNLDLQKTATELMKTETPERIEGGKFGSAAIQLDNATGKILSLAQNTAFNEVEKDEYSGRTSTVFAERPFSPGSTFKLFTLVDWLEKGHTLNERVNGIRRPISMEYGDCNSAKTSISQNPQNYGNAGGHYGTPIQFTSSSLNSGFLAMGEKLTLCDIQSVANKMLSVDPEKQSVVLPNPYALLGSQSVSLLAMASAYATVANNGVRCEPYAIEKLTEADGTEIPLETPTCQKVIEPGVAAATAMALEAPMNGGTGSMSNPRDGVPVIGKTGTHEDHETWMIEASTKVTTAVWVGNFNSTGTYTDKDGETKLKYLLLSNEYFNNKQLASTRHVLAAGMQRHANSIYGGEKFPEPPKELVQPKMVALPSVVGMTIDDASRTLTAAGFEVRVGEAVDSTVEKGKVAKQDPAAGRAATGALITLSPSTGETKNIETEVPNVEGRRQTQALEMLKAAGFTKTKVVCAPAEGAPADDGLVTKTSPKAGAKAKQGSTITVKVERQTCEG